MDCDCCGAALASAALTPSRSRLSYRRLSPCLRAGLQFGQSGGPKVALRVSKGANISRPLTVAAR
jgi:hypothetical protein